MHHPHEEDESVLPIEPIENTARILDRLAVFSGPRVRGCWSGGGVAGCKVAASAASLAEN